MLDLIPDHLRLFVVIGGLLFLLLLAGSLAQKYEQYMAARRLAVQRLMIVVRQIEDALEKARAGGLPGGLGRLLRKELLARYITMRQILPRQPGISQQIMQAEERLRTEPEGTGAVNASALTSADSLHRYVAGLNEIYGLLIGPALGRGLASADRNSFQQRLIEFQLSAASRYYTPIALEHARLKEWPNAVRAARALDAFLMTRPRSTPLAAQLRNESRELLLAMGEQRLPGAQPAASPTHPQQA